MASTPSAAEIHRLSAIADLTSLGCGTLLAFAIMAYLCHDSDCRKRACTTPPKWTRYLFLSALPLYGGQH